MKLAAYLRETGETDRAFAKRGRLSIYAVRKYKYGTRIPRPKNMGKIKKASGGKVAEPDWYTS